jgi:uncharacterized metal-binding protein YceD (DUF177 family)
MGKNQYIVKFAGLPVGTHEFEFDVSGKFFEQFSDSEISKADIKVNLVLLKQNHLMQMDFDIRGTVELACDRCLISYDFPIETQEKLVIKHGDPEESNDEILVINEGDAQANISHYLYEYITLALPSRRVPCEVDEKFDCDYDTLDKLNESESEEPEEETKEDVNPIWEKLNKIKYNKN